MFSRMTFGTRVILILGAAVGAVLLVGAMIVLSIERKHATRALLDEMATIVGCVKATNGFIVENTTTFNPDGTYHHDKRAVPIIAAWRVAQRYTERRGYQFRIPALAYRNPDHAPDPFEARALRAFRQDPDRTEYYEETPSGEQKRLRYAVPVRLTADCLSCHGEPAGELDPFGYPKEGLHVGDPKGAFSVTAPISAVERYIASSRRALWVVVLCTLLMSFALLKVIERRILTRPLLHLTEAATKLEEGDLTVHVPKRRDDEIGRLTDALNHMTTTWRTVVRRIAEGAVHVSSAMAQIVATSEQMSKAARTQSDRVTQISSAVQEIAGLAGEVSKNAQATLATADHASGRARDGAEIVTSTAEEIQRANTLADQLENQVGEIHRILRVLQEITSQTDLLALNATIEAARSAGEERGLDVVAEEIRALAARAETSTGEISGMIQDLVRQIQEVGAVMEHGTERSRETRTSLEDVVDTISATTEMVRAISRTATEQASATQEIADSVAALSEISEETAHSVKEALGAVQDLRTLADQLQEITSRFRV